jgi:adenosine kinase
LGVQTALCSWLGEDGERYLSYLCELGVDVSNVTVFSDRATPAGVILVDSREDHVLFFGDAGIELELPLPRLHDLSCAVITAGIPAHMLNLMRRCRDASVPVLVDPGKIIMDVDAGALLHAISGADTLFLNAYERDLLIRRSGVSFKNIASSVGTVVVTSGSDNVSLHMGSSVSSHPPVHTNDVKDPSGAGDAFLAGYCCGRLKGLGPEECIMIACTAASFAVEATGTQGHSFNSDTFQNRLEHSYGRQHFNL